MKKLIICTAIFFIASCASIPSDYSDEIHQKASKIVLFQGEPDEGIQYETLREVKSNSCNSETATRISGTRDEALLLLRLEAASIDANAVMNYKCETGIVDLVSNCWSSIRCNGIAIQYTEE